MDKFGVVGLNWRQGGPQALARFSLPVEERASHVQRLAKQIGVSELVYIATCNRVEVAFVTTEDIPVAEYRRRIFSALSGGACDDGRELRAWQGEGAVEHLFLVVCGLDSARLGETEIVGQVRTALEQSRASGLLKERLELLFEEALKLAKRTRAETELGKGRTSLAEIGLDQVRLRLTDKQMPVALVGVSAMTERCALSLAKEGHQLLIVNRTIGRAEELAERLGTCAKAVDLESFRASPPQVAALISATGAVGPLFSTPELERLKGTAARASKLLCVDFATDPDVDPIAASKLGCERLGMEEVLSIAENNREQHLQESGEARELVDAALTRIHGKLLKRQAELLIGAMHDSYVDSARQQADKLLNAHFQDLDEERMELLRRFAERLAKHYAHLPASGLRELASQYGPQVVQDFFSHANENLAERIGEVLDGAVLFAELREES
ncbi:MAG: glutamyl-tRNA reductase [Planctomycetota bacterium]|jgi:glutamyl-tRNA reductase